MHPGELHRAIGQAFRTIGSDPQIAVMILTSVGEQWIAGRDDTSFEGEEEDPRGRLVAALLEYQQFKEASGILHGYESQERLTYPCAGDMPPRRVEETLAGDSNVWDLVSAMGQLLKRSRAEIQHEVVTDRYSVEEQIEFVRARLERQERILLTELLGGVWTRGLLVTTFLALLELARLHILWIEQTAHFDDIVLSRRTEQHAPSALEGGE